MKYPFSQLPEEYQRYFSSTRVCFKGGEAATLGATSGTTVASELAMKQYEETEPLRNLFMQDWTQAAGGGRPGFTDTMFSGMRQPIEQQYNIGKEGILSSLPTGGAQQEALGDLESDRAGGLAGILNNIWSDQMQKAYGYATGAPQIAISQLQSQGDQEAALRANKLNAMVSSSNASAGFCCWNFLAAHGSVPEDVKQYRDEHYKKGCPVSKGYKWMSEFAVPLMETYPKFAKFMDWVMARPMTKYAQWYYGKNRYGWIFKPIANFWTWLWGEWGELPQAQKYYKEMSHGTCRTIS